MLDDLSRYYVVMGIIDGEVLTRSRRCLELAERASTEDDRVLLAGAAIVLAVAYLGQEVEFRLVQALANANAERGAYRSQAEIQEQLPAGLTARMRRLATILGGSRLYLDGKKPATIELFSAIRLRNRLVHAEGVHVIGGAGDVDASLVSGELELKIPLPKSPWQEVTFELARSVVDACQSFLEDLDRAVQSESLDDSPYYSRPYST